MKKKRSRLIIIAAVAAFAVLAAFCLFGLGFGLWYANHQSAAEARRAAPTIVVETTYPGANAQVVAETIAAPIELQVNGVEKMVQMRSRADDGTYSLVVIFEPGTDLNTAQVLVQNRVSLALPTLPELVNRAGISVRKKLPAVRKLLALTSPSGRYDQMYLSNYSSRLRDELARLPGVGDVALLGRREYGVQVLLDPE